MGKRSHSNLFGVLLIILSTAALVVAGDEAAKDQSGSSELRPRMLLDHAEDAVHSLRSVWGAQQSAIRAAAGSFLLLFGGHFTHTVLFLQSFRTAGWPIMSSGWQKLGSSYKNARAALKKEMPTLMKTRELLPKLKEEAQETFALLHEAQVKVTSLTKDFEAAQKKATQAQKMWKRIQEKGSAGMASSAADVGKLKDEALQLFAEAREKLAEAEVIQDKALAQYEDAKKIYAEALRSMNSVRAVVDAVDPEHVQEVLQGMGAGLLSCVAAAKAPVAASAVVGVDAGRILSSRLVPVMHSQLERRMPMDASARKWLDGGVSSLCSGVGLLLAYKMQGAMLTASASLMGAKLLSKFISQQAACFFGADLEGLTVERARIPRASELLPLPSAAGGRLAKLSAAHGVEAVLAGASLYWQFVGGGRTLETGQKAFAPFLAVEAWLRGMGSAEAAAAA